MDNYIFINISPALFKVSSFLAKQNLKLFSSEAEDENPEIGMLGLQHDQPVEYFGGEEGYIKGKERDERKKKLFKENDSILIEVKKGYDLGCRKKYRFNI